MMLKSPCHRVRRGFQKEHCHDEKEAAEALASYEGGSSKDRVEKGRAILKRLHEEIDPVRELMIPRQNSTLIQLKCDAFIASLGGGDCDVPPPFQQFCSIRRGQAVQQPWRGLCKTLETSRFMGQTREFQEPFGRARDIFQECRTCIQCMYLGTCIATFIYSQAQGVV